MYWWWYGYCDMYWSFLNFVKLSIVFITISVVILRNFYIFFCRKIFWISNKFFSFVFERESNKTMNMWLIGNYLTTIYYRYFHIIWLDPINEWMMCIRRWRSTSLFYPRFNEHITFLINILEWYKRFNKNLLDR
jgi:hypothetical protein